MMNHLAQESRSGSVLAERRALGICTEMSGYRGGYVRTIVGKSQGFALYPHKRVMVGLLHCATGRLNRLRSGLIHRLKPLNADARQDQQYVPKSFHLKSGCKVTTFLRHMQVFRYSRTSPHPAIRRRCESGCLGCRRNRPVHLSNVLPRLGTARRLWSNACRPGWCRTVPVGCRSSPIAESTTRPLPALPV